MVTDRDTVIELIGQLSCACAPSGFEDETCELVHEFVERELEGTSSRETNLRNVLITPAGMADPAEEPGRCRVMLDAHGDEVGLMVKSIRPNGTMTFIELGRYTGKGAPELLLDCGATSAEDAVENFHMGIGEPAVPATEFAFDPERGVMFGKAFDDRAGVAALLLTLRELELRAQEGDSTPEVDYVGCVSSQEEVGGRGVKACAASCSRALRQTTPSPLPATCSARSRAALCCASRTCP